ncbi:MAG: hypothetical protein Q8R13_04080 [bacterium]|nr:hypothetical protein [bacterium]
MNQKGFINIALIVLVIVIAGAVGYFLVYNKQNPSQQQPPDISEKKSPPPAEKSIITPSPLKKEVGGAGNLPGTRVTVLSPTGTQTFKAGNEVEIKWRTEGFDQFLEGAQYVEVYVYPSQWGRYWGIQGTASFGYQPSKILTDGKYAGADLNGGSYRWKIPENFIEQWNKVADRINNLTELGLSPSVPDTRPVEKNPKNFIIVISIYATDGLSQQFIVQ